MMDLIAGRHSDSHPGTSASPPEGFVASLLANLQRADIAAGAACDIVAIPDHPTDQDDARIVNCVSELLNGVMRQSVDAMIEGVNEFDLYQLFGACRDLAGALFTAAPVLFAAHHFGRQERQARRIQDDWKAFRLPERQDRLAVFRGHVSAATSA